MALVHILLSCLRAWKTANIMVVFMYVSSSSKCTAVPWTTHASRQSSRQMIASFYGQSGTNRLLVPPVKRSTVAVGSRAFPVAGPKTWNALPEDVTSSKSEYTFRRQLKTWLFKKSFKDIII